MHQPENAERLLVLIDKDRGALTQAAEFKREKVIIREVTKPAGMADVLKVHDFRYVRDVMEKCAILERKISALEDDATPDERNLLFRYDRDCRLSVESWKAALLSCGSALEACDAVMAKQVRNAFCAVRPPGHHAGVFGKTFKDCECDAEQTNGFCYINNVAVAASYLMSAHRDKVKKVAIVDIDVHHGNGTQEIVECAQKPKVFREKAQSSILWDNDTRQTT